MAKHAKPTFARTMKKNGARTTAALAMATTGLLAAGPIASAGVGSDHKPHHTSNNTAVEHSEAEGLINVTDNNAQVPIQVCNNYVPINVLGVQVPLEDIVGTLGVLAEETGSAAEQSEYCEQPSLQEN